MAIDLLEALSSGPSPAPAEEGPGALSTPAAPAPVQEDEATGTLGELAMAFKAAENPRDAASILVEFMETAGFKKE